MNLWKFFGEKGLIFDLGFIPIQRASRRALREDGDGVADGYTCSKNYKT